MDLRRVLVPISDSIFANLSQNLDTIWYYTSQNMQGN